MYRANEITLVHLELTTKCNASCPMCLRNVFGGKVNPHLPIAELRLEDVKKIIPLEFARQLHRLYMCGNYGDPIMATDTLEVWKYLRAANPTMNLEMFTNGSGRNDEFWRGIAETGVKVRFSVDGLGDTNAIYRRGTKFPLIEKAMRAFFAAGGQAEWDFIVFKHNEHQVEEARAFAKELGFKKFNVKKTGRFFSNTKVQVKDKQEVHNRDGEVEYYLEMPSDAKYVNSALKKEEPIIKEFGSMKNFFSQTPIDCKVAKEKSIYVSAEGFVFPCCWTANQLYPWYYPAKGAPIWKMLNTLPEGVESLNAKTHAVADIIEGRFFQNDLPDNWNIKGEQRLFVCGKTCGQGFDAFKAQFQQEPATVAPTAGSSGQAVPLATPQPAL